MSLLVNGELVDAAVLREEERTIRPRLREAMSDSDAAAIEARVVEWARENVIERTVLRQAADAGQLPVDRLLARVTAHLAKPRNKDVVDYYRKHREEFVAPMRVHAGHIIKNVDERTDEATARAGIEEAERRLRDGAKFEELADEVSDCPGRGGDLGVFAPGQMVEDFDVVVFGLQPGQVSGIFRTAFGFHIAKVYESFPEGVRELAEIREELESLLFEQKKQRAIEQYLDRLIAKAVVQDA